MSRAKYRGVSTKPPCPRCIRARWLLTFVMLAAMSVILYLDQFAA